MILKQFFVYDLWANMQWLQWLEEQGWPEPEKQVFAHILESQWVWHERLEGRPPSKMPQLEPTSSLAQELNDSWQEILRTRKPDEVIGFRRFSGEEATLRLGEIAHHVANHGTYHRGELRGLCRAKGQGQFPETDLMIPILRGVL
jgi:uncharacterized damage-inducible protein DinB